MKYLFLTYQWLVAAPILVVLTILTALLTILGSFIDSDFWGYYPAKWWSRAWCALTFVRVKVKNRELIDHHTSYVFVANHQSAYDIFGIYGFLNHNFRWMMKKSLEKVPFVGMACKAAGHIMVDNSTPTGVKHTMDDAQKKLSGGMSLVIFPEGSRSRTGKMQPFKRGAFKLATQFNLPIVPITIDGAYNVMPRTTYNIKPGRITITLHEPIHPTEEGHELESVMAKSYEAIKSSLPE